MVAHVKLHMARHISEPYIKDYKNIPSKLKRANEINDPVSALLFKLTTQCLG